eukprot:55392-Prymnesium_polylepis.1
MMRVRSIVIARARSSARRKGLTRSRTAKKVILVRSATRMRACSLSSSIRRTQPAYGGSNQRFSGQHAVPNATVPSWVQSQRWRTTVNFRHISNGSHQKEEST